ncbi:hypothetical protein [Paraburkholderia sp. GAS334]|uniref:hypothetical protein n=1 Tax=Paraburkholderia sp. GAS334 TaxID=3035131 RepID=UPI003D1936FE
MANRTPPIKKVQPSSGKGCTLRKPLQNGGFRRIEARRVRPVAIGVFPGAILFVDTLIESRAAPIYRYTPQKTGVTLTGKVAEMEKWMVVAGIWTMCALCAVFFIRGASCPAAKRMEAARVNARNDRSAKSTS